MDQFIVTDATTKTGLARSGFIAQAFRGLANVPRTVSCLIILALTLTSGFTWSAVFGLSAVLIPVTVSVLAAAALAVVGKDRSVGQLTAIGIVGIIVSAHFTVARAESFLGVGIPSPSSLRAVFDGFRNGWSTLLTSPLPLGVDASRGMPMHLSVFVASFVGLLVVMRSQTPFAASFAPIVVIGLSRIFGATGNGRWVISSLFILLGIGLLAVVLSQTQDGQTKDGQTKDGQTQDGPVKVGRTRTETSAHKGFSNGPVIAGLVVAAISIASLLVTQSPLFPRQPADARRPPSQRLGQAVANPLSLLTGWARNPNVEMFRFKIDSSNPEAALIPRRWRLTVLDQFTGSTWLPGESFVETGAVLPKPPPAIGIALDVSPTSAEVTLSGLTGSWIPVPGWPISLVGIPTFVDVERGALLYADAGQITNVTDLLSFRVRALPLITELPPEAQQLTISGEQLDVPQIPAEFANLAQQAVTADATQGPLSDPRSRAQLLEARLRSTYLFDPNALPGHSYRRLLRLLTDGSDVGRRGTSEQFATAFAVLARQLGMPTRVVVGFDIPANTSPDGTGNTRVTAGMAKAWPEVHFADAGWVPFDPTPTSEGVSITDAETLKSLGTRRTTPTTPLEEASEITLEPAEPPVETKANRRPIWLLLGALSVCALAILWAVASTARRRQHLRRGPARHQIANAWTDAMVSLNAAQLFIGPGETSNRFVERVHTESIARGNTIVHDQMATLSTMLDDSQFGKGEPSIEAATEAWIAADRIRAQILTDASIGQKLRLRCLPQ